MASKRLYDEFINSELTLGQLADLKGIKCTTARNYIMEHYDSRDARRIMQKLDLDPPHIDRAYHTLLKIQNFVKHNTDAKASMLTSYLHEALGKRCNNCCLASSIIKRLYNDICAKK